MEEYKIYRVGNYIKIVNAHNCEIFNGAVKEVFVDASNVGKGEYRFFNVKDWKDAKSLKLNQIKKQDGTAYTLAEWETFYTENSVSTNGGIPALAIGASTEAKQDAEILILESIDSKTPALGQGTVATSTPTVLPQSQIDVLTPPPAITGFNLESTQQLIKAKTDNLDVALSTRNAEATQLEIKEILSNSNSYLNNIRNELLNSIAFSESIWYDSISASPNVLWYVRNVSVDQTTGVQVVSWKDLLGAVATPIVANLQQTTTTKDYEINTVQYKAIVAGTGYSINDRLEKLQIFLISNGSATLTETIWNNETTGLILGTAPTFVHLIVDDTYATKAKQQEEINLLTNIQTFTGETRDNLGNKLDAIAGDDLLDYTLIAIQKSAAEKLKGIKNGVEYLQLPDHLINENLVAIKEVFDNPLQVTQTQISRTEIFQRLSGTNTITAPFHKLYITPISNDVTKDTVPILLGMTYSLEAELSSIFNADVVVDGTDYYIQKII